MLTPPGPPSGLASKKGTKDVTIAIKYWLAGVLFLIILLALTGCKSIDEYGNQTIHYDPGGIIGDRRAEIRTLIANDTYTRIEGTCASTCTMYLQLMQHGLACVAPDARLQFHGSTYGALGIPLPVGHPHKDGADRLMSEGYPPNLRAWYWNDARFGGGLKTMTGAEIAAMDPGHVALCE